MFEFSLAPSPPHCRGAGSFPICCLSQSGRCPDRPDDSQCPGGDIAGNDRIGTSAELGLGYSHAQGIAAQISHAGDRLDADSLPWATGLRCQGDFSRRAQIGHHAFSRLRHGGGSAQGLPVYLGADTRRVRRIDEGGCPTLAGDCPSAGGQDPFSPAGQGVFQRGSDSVSSPCPLRFHHSRGRTGPEAQGSQIASAWVAHC